MTDSVKTASEEKEDRIINYIASLAATFNLDNVGINILLEGYSDNFIAINQEKLKKWISFTYYLDYLWRMSIVKLDDSYNKTMKLDEFESFLLNL